MAADALIPYDLVLETLTGSPLPLDRYRGQVLLIVNTASKCGFTPQLEGLEALHARFRDRGFAVLGFPSNQFAAQDPGSNDEIAEFCTKNYGVSFPMFAKADVNGPAAQPLYRWLTAARPGLLGTRAIKWNFTKFLVSRQGRVVGRYGPLTKPAQLVDEIERLLAEPGAAGS